MKNKILFFILFLAGVAYSQEQKSVDITIYNNNLGVVKDVREFDLKQGNSIILMKEVPTMIDPTSVKINFNGIVNEQNYQYDLVSMDKILNKYIDKTITLKNKDESITGKLLSSGGQVVIQKPEGGLVMIPNVQNYNISVDELPTGFITRPTLVWDINSNKSGKQNVEVTYHTEGINWHAEYVAVLNKDDSKMDLNSWVSIENNSGASFKNSNLKLMAGKVNRVSGNDGMFRAALDFSGESGNAPKFQNQFVESSFFEYHLYELQRKTNLMNNETKQVSLFESKNIPVKKLFVYESYFGNQNSNAKVMIEFLNSKENNLGMPFPAGIIRINKEDGSNIAFIGEDAIKHTPKDEKLLLKVGEAFDVLVEEILLENNVISKRVSEQEYEITLKNRKDSDIIVDVIKDLGMNGNFINSEINPKYKGKEMTFKVPVKNNSEFKFKIKVRFSY